MSEILNIQVWQNPSDQEDQRAYVTMDDRRRGWIYVGGNFWHRSGEREGQLTDIEWARAQRIAYWDDKWHTLGANKVQRLLEKLPIELDDVWTNFLSGMDGEYGS
jgi:hypothetical protein